MGIAPLPRSSHEGLIRPRSSVQAWAYQTEPRCEVLTSTPKAWLLIDYLNPFTFQVLSTGSHRLTIKLGL